MVTVQVTTTSTPMDIALNDLAWHLTHRLDAGAKAPLIDVAALGMRDADADANPMWRDKDIYPIRLYAGTLLLGPLREVGGGGACPRCLERRWLTLRPELERDSLEAGEAAIVTAPPPGVTGYAAEAACQITQSVMSGAADAAAVYQLRLDTLEVARYSLLPDSRCPVCADQPEDTAEAAVLSLREQPKRSITDYRLRSAAELALPMEALVNPVCGVIGAAAGRAYQVAATAPVNGFFRARAKFGLHQITWSGHADNFAASEQYGVLEGLERYAGQTGRGRRVSIFDSYDNLKPDALDPLVCGVYEDETYETHAPFYRPYRSDQPMHWVWGYSFRERRAILVPEQLVFYLDHRVDQPNFIQECSNGCASGSCHEEAVLHGLLELVERDSFLLNWHAARRPPEIDIDTCGDRRVHYMRDRLALIGYDTHLFDLRIDLPMPTVMAVAVRRGGGAGSLCFAAGAGMDPDQAAHAALCETASYVTDLPERVVVWQERLTGMVGNYRRVTEMAHHSMLYGLPEMAVHAEFLFGGKPRPMPELYADWEATRPATLDLRDDVQFCVDRIFGLGLDVIVVDQTSPEQTAIGVNTVCVLAPGLVPIDFGWDRQRVLRHPRLHALLGGAPVHLHPHPFP